MKGGDNTDTDFEKITNDMFLKHWEIASLLGYVSYFLNNGNSELSESDKEKAIKCLAEFLKIVSKTA